MKWVTLILLFFVTSSCVNEKRATKWFDKNLDKAAYYMNSRFPPTYKTDTLYLPLDSADYWDAYYQSTYKIDSLIDELNAKPKILLIPSDSSVKINLDSLKRLIKYSLLKTLKPCVDSQLVVQKEKRNLVAEYLLNKRIDSLSYSLETTKTDLVVCKDKNFKLIRVAWNLGLILFIAILYITRSLWLKILP